MFNYNSFHLKNTQVQTKIIDNKNYTYQTLIALFEKYFVKEGEVLDLGCGVGTIDFYLAIKGMNVVGVDISDRAVGLANLSKNELKLKNVRFCKSSLEEYSDNQVYDYIVCSEVLEHVESPSIIIEKMYGLLKKNGLAIISTPSLNAPLYKIGRLKNFDKKVGHLRRYSSESLKSLLLKPGFVVIDSIKTEGLLRNFMYTNDYVGFLLRFFRFPITLLINVIDNCLMKLFGESNIYIVIKKI